MNQKPIYVDLLGCEVYQHHGSKYTTRIIEAGDGPALIMMHGGGGHAEAYSRNIARLARKFRVMSVDFIWHGLSSKPAFRAGNWLQQFTDQILELMDSMGLAKASFEGESLGGWVAMDLGIRYPQRVDKLVLNTAWGGKFDPKHVEEVHGDLDALRRTSLDALEHPDRAKFRKRMEWLMAPEKVTDELVEVRYHLWSRPDTNRALKEYYERLFHPSCDDYLFDEAMMSKITSPTLVLWTDRNPLHGVDAARRLQQLIRGSELYIIKNAAHWPQWEQPEEHDEVVMKFLQGSRSPAG